jgi:uracil-DNA glycosylase
VLCARDEPPAFLLWGKRAQAFFDEAAGPAPGAPVWRTRHPAHDFQRGFMAEGSHFLATAGCVDWWSAA